MDGYIDIHCHILPGVDDGSADMGMTRKMLEIAWKEGITCMIATPHYHEGYADAPPEKLRAAYQEVVREAQKLHDGFQIYLGSELYSRHGLAEQLDAGRVLTMAGTRYVLAEFSPSRGYSEMEASLRSLQMAGYRPILAHAERYACLLQEPDRVEDLTDMGIYIQVNAMSVTGENGFATRTFVKKLMKYEMVHFLGTDAHSTGRRRPLMRKCVSYIEKKYGARYAKKISRENAVLMLQDQPV